MKRLAFATALLATPAFADGELKIYHWFDYIPQELVDKFTAETGIAVTIDTYDSNEAMLASLKAGKMGQYDVAVPGDYMVQIMGNEGLLDSFAPTDLSNFGNIDPKWVDVPFDPGRKSSIPYQWGSTAFSVNRDVYKGDIDTLAIVFDPPAELSGKINALDSQGEVLALGSMYLGMPQCNSDRTQLKALSDMLLNAKTHWASFGSDTAKDVLVSGDAAAGMIYNGFSARARAEGANVEYAYPKEGFVVWMDNVVLLKDAPNRDNALKFMNFLLVPENAAAVTNHAAYTSGVMGVEPFLDDAIKNSPENNPPASAPAGEFIAVCDEPTQKLYDAIWTNLKK
ncbi:MAG: extracellular solute-binding protein [Rhodobacteraceae bacterium]|jgi:spermidine/putrescine transport system substrate-binding protein|nr:extracellular solute-binding protein [Paracoccaceae bacterium]MCF8513209.1 extracellular solute-binding protein [Paracoccaceae bacterium]MCF8517892.1 extracellular solute-binding protein [Paracoccaceae bacterium]